MRFTLLPHVLVLALGAAALCWPLRDIALEIQAIDDPVARADVQLRGALNADRVASEMTRALDAGDTDLAQSFVELATAQGVALPPGPVARLHEIRSDHSASRAARDFSAGFANGDMGSGMGMTGALAADLSGYGDLRDLMREGHKWLNGEPADHLVLGLSAAGLAITGATIVTLGASLPARGGLTLAKGLQKAGRLSKPLTLSLTRAVGGALDKEALSASVVALRRFEFTAAREAGANVLRPASLTGLRAFGADIGAISRNAGVRGAQDVLAVAASPAEVRAAARLTAQKGVKSRAILRVLGRGVLLAGTISLTLFSWAFTLVLWFFAAASLARRMGERIGRLVWRINRPAAARHPSPSRSAAYAD